MGRFQSVWAVYIGSTPPPSNSGKIQVYRDPLVKHSKNPGGDEPGRGSIQYNFKHPFGQVVQASHASSFHGFSSRSLPQSQANEQLGIRRVKNLKGGTLPQFFPDERGIVWLGFRKIDVAIYGGSACPQVAASPTFFVSSIMQMCFAGVSPRKGFRGSTDLL